MSRDSGPNVFQRGVMALILLSLLRREDMYGYQLVQETERRSGGRLKTQEGSLYPVLYRLQEQGLISDHRVLVGKRMTRVYYHLEPAGEARLEEMIREYESMMTGVTAIIREEAPPCGKDSGKSTDTSGPSAAICPVPENTKTAADGAAQRGGGLLRRNPERRPGSPVRDAPAGGCGVCGRHEHPGAAGRPAAAASGADDPDRGGAGGAAAVGGGPLRQPV